MVLSLQIDQLLNIPITKVLMLQIDKIPRFWCYKYSNYQGSDVTNIAITKFLMLQIYQLQNVPWFWGYN